MEPIFKKTEIKYKLDWELDTSIYKIKKDIEEIEKLGATHVYIESHGDAGWIEIKSIRLAPETNFERDLRLEQERQEQENQKQNELRLLAQLKAKYENNS